MKNLKIFGGMITLVAALATISLKDTNVYAEEESFVLEDISDENSQVDEQSSVQSTEQNLEQSSEQNTEQGKSTEDSVEQSSVQSTEQSIEQSSVQSTEQSMEQSSVQSTEEVLYVQTDDNFILEDIQENQNNQGDTSGQENGDGQENSDVQGTVGEDGYEETFDPNRTDIDPEDQRYNTGRTEIPDTVLTEAERKGIQSLTPETPETNQSTPDNSTPSTSTSNDSTPSTSTPNDTTPNNTTPTPTPTPTPVPKMGLSLKSVASIGGAIGLVIFSYEGIKYKIAMDNAGTKVVKSKKKYHKKRNKTKKR